MTTPEQQIREMEQSIIDYLRDQKKGYGFRKNQISKATGIPLDVLTVLLKRLKDRGEIDLIMIWSDGCI